MPFRVAAVALLAFVSQTTVAAEPLSVGVGVAEITPPLGYPMSGYFFARGATGVLDPLQAKAIAFKQRDAAAVLIVADLISIDRRLADAARNRIAERTGVPPQNVVISATHTHTGPNYWPELALLAEAAGDPAKVPYVPLLIERLADAAAAAVTTAAPAALRVGSGREETVAFNRRGLLKDGTARTWAKNSDPDVVGRAGPIDPELGLVAVTPAGGDGPTAAIVNFALHCDTVGGSQYSADYPGHVERVLRKDLGPGFVSVFATGTCGDINHIDYFNNATGRSSAEIGERLAAAATSALPSLQPLSPDLAVRQALVEIPLQTYTDEDLAWANDVIARDRKGESLGTTLEAKAYKIRRLRQLRTGKTDRGRDSDEETDAPEGPRDRLPAEVQVVRLGETAALVALPGEVFVELGLAIKERSPFEHTFVIELANDSPTYVPTRKAMEQGGYEPNNSLYAPGGGETLVETAVALLKELKPN